MHAALRGWGRKSMTISMPTISIGLPVYNGERYLREAIDSVLKQTFRDIELIISDNASTDGTEAICREYANRDQRVRYVRNNVNEGAAGNFRRTFELASGKYFKWVAVDDITAPDFLEKCKRVLDERSHVVVCTSKVSIIDENGAVLRQYADRQDLLQDRASQRFAERLRQDSWCNAVYGLMRADILSKTKLLGSYSGSDEALMLELSLYGCFAELPEYLLLRREHPGAYSYQCNVEKVKEFYAPAKTRQSALLMRLWRHLFEYTSAIVRAPLAIAEKGRLLFQVLRLAWWKRSTLAAEVGSVCRSLLRL